MEKAKAANPSGVGVVPNPKLRLLDQVREVSEKSSGSSTIPFGPKTLTFNGSNGLSFSMANGIRGKWERGKSRRF